MIFLAWHDNSGTCLLHGVETTITLEDMAILAEVPCYGKKVNNALRNIEAQKAANWMMRRKKSLKVEEKE
jgi:hypothetical protein